MISMLIFAQWLAFINVADCTCSKAMLEGGWCGTCHVGYVAGQRIASADLFEALDAHGHDIQPERIACASCQAALKVDGYCEPCGMGFVKKQAYLSRLAYHLAAGELTEPSKTSCDVCRGLSGKSGWCDACKKGWVGFVAIRDPNHYQIASKAYEILVEAVKTLPRCEICAIAMVTNARCLKCKVAYRNGVAVRDSNAGPGRGTIQEPESDQSRAREEAVP